MKHIKKKLIYTVIFLLGIYIIYQSGIRMLAEWKVKFTQSIQASVERIYLPNLTGYGEGKSGKSLQEWIAEQAMKVAPLGGYVQDHEHVQADVEDSATRDMILAMQAEDENLVDADGNLIGDNKSEAPTETHSQIVKDISIEQLRDFDYLLSNFYTVDSTTMIDSNQLNVDELLSKNMKIGGQIPGPKVLIFHTHSQEYFVDSTEGDISTGIVGVGSYLAQQLNAKGIETIHHDGIYDFVGGKLDRSKAYEFSEVGVREILKNNPSVEVVIDLHRDGVRSDTRLVTNVNQKETAKIMFFNGLSRTRANGDIAYLQNPYIQDNLSFSLQMQLASESMYPGFARRIYLKGYRYSLHMMPKSLLVEAGAQTNTIGEMQNAMELLANVLYHVLAE